MKKTVLFLVTIFLFFNGMLKGQNANNLTGNKNIQNEIRLIQSAGYIINHYGDSIWENISKTPLRILLITDSLEYLFNHNNPGKSFVLFQYDSLLNKNIYVRPRMFPPFLRATFPAVNGLDCIVVGNPKNTNKSNEDWVVMLLHEHFHLYQGENPLYKENVALLAQKIAKDSENWMLDYDFPYNDPTINKLFKEYSNSIYETYLSLNKVDFMEKMNIYIAKELEIQNQLTSNDNDYFRFQIWQEGIATFTELKYLEALNNSSKHFKEIYVLDFTLKNNELIKAYTSNFLTNDLSKDKRNVFYSIGLLEGIIKDETNPKWKTDYFKMRKDL